MQHSMTQFDDDEYPFHELAFDQTRDDPCNMYLLATAPAMILYIELSVSPITYRYIRISDIRLEGPLSNVNVPSMFRATPFKIYI